MTHLHVEAEVRYWEDADVNGVNDDEEGTLIPLRRGDLWCPVIELATGTILNWPTGTIADIHYKVCDAGEYWIGTALDRQMKWKGSYVPDKFLCHGDQGYGDYIIFKVDDTGKILNWRVPAIELSDWCIPI